MRAAWRVRRETVAPDATEARDVRLRAASAPPDVTNIALPLASLARLKIAPVASLEHFTESSAPELIYVPPVPFTQILGLLGQRHVPAAAFLSSNLAYAFGSSWAAAAAAADVKEGVAYHGAALRAHEDRSGLFSLGELVALLRAAHAVAMHSRFGNAVDARFFGAIGNFRGLFSTGRSENAFALPALYALVRVGIDDATPEAAERSAFSDTPVPARTASDAVTVRRHAVSWQACLRALEHDALVQTADTGDGDGGGTIESAAVSLADSVDVMRTARDTGDARAISWVPGAVVLPARTRLVCDALAWSTVAAPIAPGAETGDITGADDCEIPLLLAWLAANSDVARQLRNVHALSLARFGILAPLVGVASGAGIVASSAANPHGARWGTWTRCRTWATAGASAAFQGHARDADETRQFLHAVATMCMVDLALGGTTESGQIDACSALFVWLVHDLVRVATGHPQEAVLPVSIVEFAQEYERTAEAADTKMADSGGGAPAASVSARAAVTSALTSVVAGAGVNETAVRNTITGVIAGVSEHPERHTVSMLKAALPRLIVWHRAFVRAVRVRDVETMRTNTPVDVFGLNDVALPAWMQSQQARGASAPTDAHPLMHYYQNAVLFALNTSEYTQQLAERHGTNAFTDIWTRTQQALRCVSARSDAAWFLVLDDAASKGARFMDAFPVPLSVYATQ